MNKMEILIIISALLLPVNLYCSFWIFREVLNLSGITFREMLKDLNGLAIPSGRFGKGMRRRQKILLNYLLKRSYEPEKTQMLFRRYKHSITPGVIAVILTDYIAFSKSTNKISATAARRSNHFRIQRTISITLPLEDMGHCGKYYNFFI